MRAMKFLLRFHLYTDSSRESYHQLGPDQWVDQFPQFIFGLPYRLESEEFGKIGNPGQVYVVANPINGKPIVDSATSAQSRFRIDLFLARLEEWGWFEEAPEIRKNRPNDTKLYQSEIRQSKGSAEKKQDEYRIR